MILTPQIQQSIKKSVLCWLATASAEGIPNVSPKECFCTFGEDSIIVANIASPNTIKNIKQNENICISFIDIFVQKGFQLKGKAEIIEAKGMEFEEMEKVLLKMTQGKFPFQTVTKIRVESARPILAPSYLLFPDITEEQQIENAKETYQI